MDLHTYFEKHLTDERIYIYVLVLAILLLLSVPFMRFIYMDGIQPGVSVYYDLSIEKAISLNSSPGVSEQVGLLKTSFPQLDHLFYGILGRYMDLEVVTIIFPIIFGLLTALLLLRLLKKLRVGRGQSLLSGIIFVASPLFINIYTGSFSVGFSLFLISLGFNLLLTNKTYILSILVFCLVPFVGFAHAIILLIILCWYYYLSKRQRGVLLIILLVLILSLIISQPIFELHRLWVGYMLNNQFYLQRLIADLGSNTGLSIFALLLTGVGWFVMWPKNKALNIFLLILFFMSFFWDPYLGYLNVLLSLFAGVGLYRLLTLKWEFEILKEFTILLICCGLLFSTISYVNRDIHALPDESVVQSLMWLEKRVDQNTVVLTNTNYEDWVTYYSGAQIAVSTHTQVSSILNRLDELRSLYYTRNIALTIAKLDEWNVRYIWIHPLMKQGEVWSEADEGFLFLLENSDNFKLVYNRDGIEIWEYGRK